MRRRELVRFVQALSMASSYAELERVFLEGFGRIMNAPMYGLHLFDPESGHVLHNANVNISDACIARYEREAIAEDPLLAYALKTGRAAYNLALMSMEEWLDSPVYRKALYLHDIRHAISAPVLDTRGVVGTLYCATSDPDGAYKLEDVELAEALGRLIGGAIERIEAAERLERERDHALSALDLSGTAVVISDPQSLEPHLNGRAQHLVADVVNGEAHLHRLIARPGRAGGFSRRLAVELAAGGRGVLHAHSKHAARDDAGLITVLELERDQPKFLNGSLNALTAREGEIAMLVTEGLSDRVIAERLHLSHHTVSQHIKRIYRKLHVDSRVALTRLLLTPQSFGERG